MTFQKTRVERSHHRAYLREFIPGMVGYVVALGAVIALVDFDNSGAWKYVVALTPVVPALISARAIARHVKRVDEMQGRIQVDAMAVGFGLAMISAITIGFLAMAGLDTNSWGPWLIYSAGMLGWLVSSTRIARAI